MAGCLPPSTGTVLLSFDETPPAFTDMGAYGGALPTVEPGPTGGTGKALKILKPVSPDTWGGVFFTMARHSVHGRPQVDHGARLFDAGPVRRSA